MRLGTVDIFQGQEAKIVIVSLMRNLGEFETDNASIGILKVIIALCCSVNLADFDLVGDPYQRCSIKSQARPLCAGQRFKSTEKFYLVHDHGGKGSDRLRFSHCLCTAFRTGQDFYRTGAIGKCLAFGHEREICHRCLTYILTGEGALHASYRTGSNSPYNHLVSRRP